MERSCSSGGGRGVPRGASGVTAVDDEPVFDDVVDVLPTDPSIRCAGAPASCSANALLPPCCDPSSAETYASDAARDDGRPSRGTNKTYGDNWWYMDYDDREKTFAAAATVRLAVEGEAATQVVAAAVRDDLVSDDRYVLRNTGSESRGGRRLPYPFAFSMRSLALDPGEAPAPTSEDEDLPRGGDS